MHYETSAYAKPGRRCRHNRNYWEFGDYLGIGAGAHSKLSFAERIVRQLRYKQPRQYLAQVRRRRAAAGGSAVTREDVGFEFMLNALRLIDGVPATLFAERTGYPLSLVARALEAAVRRGLLEPDPATLKPTALGRRFLNDLQELFLASARRTSATRRAARARGSHRSANDECEDRHADRGGGGRSRARARTAAALAEAQLARIAQPTARSRRGRRSTPRTCGARRRDATARRSRGPLAGIGVGVKDIIDTADLPHDDGLADLRRAIVRAADAQCVARLRAAGAYVFGKTVTTPFAFMDPGKTRNPWNAAHSPGGSSSGSAAAVAAGHVLAAIGTQTNGSVVRPAAYCGVVGFKPTLHAIPYAGAHLFSGQFDTVGTFTRTVADAARLASVLADPGRIAPSIAPLPRAPRLAFLAHFPWTAHDAATDEALRRGGRECSPATRRSPRVEIPPEWRDANVVLRTIMLHEAAVALGDCRRASARGSRPTSTRRWTRAARIGRRPLSRRAGGSAPRALAFFTQWLDAFDAVLAPSAPAPAPRGLDDHRRSLVLHAVVAAAVSRPSTCPSGLVGRGSGRPAARAPQHCDDRVLAVAAWCEARLPFVPLAYCTASLITAR